MRTVLAFLPVDPIIEATGDGTARRAQRARRAALDVIKDRNQVERDTVQTLGKRLATLKGDLKNKLLADDGSVTDFQRFSVSSLLRDVDQLITDTTDAVANDTRGSYSKMADLGELAADEPMKAAQLKITAGLPGLDAVLIGHAFDNTVELLTTPMQQFATDVKVALRGVALAGDQKFAAIQKLRDKISGQGFDNAQYKAERIIRTELGRVFNESNYSRLDGLAKEFPFIRKGWRATGDNRTRPGHIEAGRIYSRGSGIAITDKFQIKVYDSGPGGKSAPKLIGIAFLRFPLDPQATPSGRVAAGATIMCRCNAFVDFDLADFAEFSAKQIQLAMGGVLPPTVPAPAPVPASPRTPRTTRPRTRVPKPKVAAPVPAPPVTGPGPTEGPKVSSALKIPAGPKFEVARQTMKILDSVHSDGVLGAIPLKASQGNFYGMYTSYSSRAVSIKLSNNGLANHPMNTLAHEVGHWLDHLGIPGKGYGGSFYASSAGQPLMKDWLAAVKSSEAIQTLNTWYKSTARTGRFTVEDGIVPAGASRKHLSYLLSTHETFARSYAQYVAVASGDAAMLAELRRMQGQLVKGPVPKGTPFSPAKMGKTPIPGTWQYPTVWSDEDFEPIRKAFDALFEATGWRKK